MGQHFFRPLVLRGHNDGSLQKFNSTSVSSVSSNNHRLYQLVATANFLFRRAGVACVFVVEVLPENKSMAVV